MNTFTNREEYLAAVKIWKVEYAQLTLDIRQDRLNFKQSQRDLSKCKPYRWKDNRTAEEVKAWCAARSLTNSALTSREALIKKANGMLQNRATSKIEAARQMQCK